MPLIDVEKAWKAAQRIYSDPVLLHAIKNVLDSTETIEAAPVVHGRWDGPFRVDANHNGYKCSVCGYFGVPGWVACPKCAARMDGVNNGNTL